MPTTNHLTPPTPLLQITGGGLAGLGLGLLLQRTGIPVRLHEAGSYPRHRVCGEFISGLSPQEWEALGLADVIKERPRHTETAWFGRDGRLFARPLLPEPAVAISRYALDAAMAQKLRLAGGDVREKSRVATSGEGWVSAHGRQREPLVSPWMGLKTHYLDLPLEAGLEMHTGDGGYVGLTDLGHGRVNVCALLPSYAGEGGDRATLLPRRLRAIGLRALATRLEHAVPDSASVTGVTHFRLGWQRGLPRPTGLYLGDHVAIIPPFTGNGMTMALQSALVCAPYLQRWSAGDLSWEQTCRDSTAAIAARFRRRLRWASCLHPFLLTTMGQRALRAMAACGLLPFDWLYRRLR